MSSSRRLARLLQMLTLFQGSDDWGPKALAARFGISETRIYDDIQELNRAGIPVSFKSTGYRLAKDYFLPALNLTPQDVLDLLYPQALFNDPDPSRRAALQSKVLSALPPELRDRFRDFLACTDISTGSTTPHAGVFEQLHRAIAERRRIEVLYYDFEAKQTSVRQADPYGLIYRRRSWYCVARCLRHDQVRKFRLSRMRELKLLSFYFDVPKDFSLSDYIDKSWEVFDGEPVEVLIRFSPSIAPLIAERPARPGESIQNFSNGSILYRTVVKGIDEIGWWVIQYGAEAEVLRPASLRKKLLDTSRQLVDIYTAPQKMEQDDRLVAEDPEPYGRDDTNFPEPPFARK